jgi:uracil-DNA glycosylase
MSWEQVQKRILACEICKGHPRVETNIRQQTLPPRKPCAFLLVGVAPPHQASPCGRIIAKSATNDPGDNLRKFIEEAVGVQWDDLIAKGAFLVHAVKCAIVPDAEGFQNPPNDVVDQCSSIGFIDELYLLCPARIVAFGGAARRAVLKHPAIATPHGAGVSKTFKKLNELWPNGIPCKFTGRELTLHPAPFPRSHAAKKKAAIILRDAADLAAFGNATG